MKSIYLVVLFFSLFLFERYHAQQNVLITDNTATVPDASSLLELNSTNKGLLIPRVSLLSVTDGTTITLPAPTLLVYNTNNLITNGAGKGYYYNDGTSLAPNWQKIISGNTSGSGEWKLLGNSGTIASTNFLGTIDNVDLVFRTNNTEKMRVLSGGNVGIGTATPAYRLDLATGTFGFGNSNVRTETRDNAGLQGNAGGQSGFYETANPSNYPLGASSWWHMLDIRHSNNSNNYAMQFSGSFFDQNLFFRKTNNLATQPWTQIITNNYWKANEFVLASNNQQTSSTTVWLTFSGLQQTLTLEVGDRVLFDLAGAVSSTTSYGYHQISVGISSAPAGGPAAGSFILGLTGGATGAGKGASAIANHDYSGTNFNRYAPFAAVGSFDVGTAGNYTFDVYIRTATGGVCSFGGNNTQFSHTSLKYTIIRQ
jgi:hypothetical protein